MPRNRKEASRRYYLSHREECLARGRKYMAANREKQLAYQKQWREDNRRHRKDLELRRNFNITIEEYETQLKKQNSVCASCGDPPEKGKNLSVDHNHKTGVPRALLCSPCNIGVGNFKDDPARLKKAIKYLKKTRKYKTAFGLMAGGSRERLP